jgi:4-hydroxymandelate oxidase
MARTRTTRSAGGFQTLTDLESAAAKKAKPTAWAYVQGGAGEERTMKANLESFQRRTFRPQVLEEFDTVDLGTTMVGEKVSAPFYVCPMAYQGLLHRDGEAATARAASAADVQGVFSTVSSLSMEKIAEAAPKGPRWFQLYLQPEWDETQRLIERAERSGYRAIVLTVDLAVTGSRDRQAMAGFRWDASAAAGNGNIVLPTLAASSPDAHAFALRNGAPAGWDVIDRIRGLTRLPVLVKGILTRDDAEKAVEHGAQGVVVSNHGGRQLDGAPASLDALPEVVEAVGGKVEVYLDSGVRRGGDVLTALALGARGVGIGRPVLWGLAVGGEAGVEKVLSLFKAELATSMFLTGRRKVSEVDRTLLNVVPA